MTAHAQRGRTARRAAWALADQAVSSATNFALTILVANVSSANGFGAFAFAISLAITTAAITRGLSNDPLASRFSGAQPSAQMVAIRGAVSTALCVGLLGSGAALLATFATPPSWTTMCLALSTVVPGVILQDTLRSVYLVKGSPRAAFANDSVWALLLTIGCLVAFGYGAPSPARLLLAWGLSGTACALIGCWHLRVLPGFTRWLRWLAQNTDLWPFYLTDNALFQFSNLLLLSIIAAHSGLTDVAGMRAVGTVFGPLVVLAQAVSLFAIPEISRRAPTSILVRRAAVILGVTLALVALGLGLGGYLLPARSGAALLGETWQYTRPLLLFATVDTMAVMLTLGAVVGLRALSQARGLLATRVVTLGIRFTGGVTGAGRGGAPGALATIAALAPIIVALWYRALWRATRSSLGDQHQRSAAQKRDWGTGT